MKTKNNDILGPDGQIEARTCVDCGETKKFEEFQRTPKQGNRSSDCKACRRKKFEAGMAARGHTNAKPGTKEWVIEQATILFNRSNRDNDKAKFLDIISRNISLNAKDLTDDSKLIRDLMASKKKALSAGK